MPAEEVLPGLHQITVGVVNAFLVTDGDTLVLVDTGPEKRAQGVLRGIWEAGYDPTEVDHILVTHSHQDHAGGLAEVKEATGAEAWMHPDDASLVEQGHARRPWSPTPGVLNRILYWIYVRGVPDEIPEAHIDHRVEHGDTVPGTMEAIHIPGHCKGQVAFLWPRHGGVLFVGDAAMNFLRLRLPLVHENLDEARTSLRRLSVLDFDKAMFGHGEPILEGAAPQFRRRFGDR